MPVLVCFFCSKSNGSASTCHSAVYPMQLLNLSPGGPLADILRPYARCAVSVLTPVACLAVAGCLLRATRRQPGRSYKVRVY
jgi:hypothetical protein